MGLHVGEGAIEQAAGALNRELLGDVDIFATTVIPAARITFRIFISQDRSLRLEHRTANDVFRGDQLNLLLLAFQFLANRFGDFRVSPGQSKIEEIGFLLPRLTHHRHHRLSTPGTQLLDPQPA